MEFIGKAHDSPFRLRWDSGAGARFLGWAGVGLVAGALRGEKFVASACPPTKPPLFPSAASDVRDPHAGRMRSPEEESNALRWGEAQFEAVVIAEMTRCFIFSAGRRKGHSSRMRSCAWHEHELIR